MKFDIQSIFERNRNWVNSKLQLDQDYLKTWPKTKILIFYILVVPTAVLLPKN
jgi:hypothetical protein